MITCIATDVRNTPAIMDTDTLYLITVVSVKSARGWSTLQVCQRRGWGECIIFWPFNFTHISDALSILNFQNSDCYKFSSAAVVFHCSSVLLHL